MSDTPRTDAISGWGVTYRGKSSSEELYIDPKGPFVHSTFARQLERELNAANERIKRLEAAGDEMASAWDKEWLTEADIEAIIDDWHGAKEAKP